MSMAINNITMLVYSLLCATIEVICLFKNLCKVSITPLYINVCTYKLLFLRQLVTFFIKFLLFSLDCYLILQANLSNSFFTLLNPNMSDELLCETFLLQVMTR